MLIVFLAGLALAFSLALISMEDPGYVLISRAPYEIEVSLALFAVLLLALFALAYFGLRLLFRTLNARRDLARWNDARNQRRAGRDMLQGYARLIEGDWLQAERELLQRIEYSDTPLLNHLGAAYAAQQMGALEKRDHYLDAALASDRRLRDAVQITRTRLQYQAGQLESARQTLEALPSATRKRASVERMEAEILRSLGDYPALEKSLPKYRRHQSFNENELHDLERQALAGNLERQLKSAQDPKGMDTVWKALPRQSRRDTELVLEYVQKLLESGQDEAAEEQIITAMSQNYDARLVDLFAAIDRGQGAAQARQCLVWLEKHGEHAELLLAVARLKKRIDENQVAKDFYLKAIRKGAGEAAYLELGAILEHDGETEEAGRLYRRGLELRNASVAGAEKPLQLESK